MQRTHRNTTTSALVATAFILAASSATFTHARDLSFEERVKAQQAIEQVYWNHRIWPEQNSRAKPVLDQVLPASAIEAKVRAYLRLSDALREAGRPVTHQQLLDEMDRMARDSKAPGVLRELFAALGDDADLIADTLVRQKLVTRLGAAPPADGAGGAPIPKGASSAAASGTNDTFAMTSIGCEVEAWSPTSTGPGAPTGRTFHTAVSTGSEMIVWGGTETGASDFPTDTGGRYDPATDTWIPTSVEGAPQARSQMTALWTGTEMIVWGGNTGSGFVASGGRYNPTTDSWVPTTTVDAPLPRALHTAVWTGSRMVVWGGSAVDVGGNHDLANTGGRYDPATDRWTPTSTMNVPLGREEHTAVWTGTEMIVWGGRREILLDSGGRYDPVADSWAPTATAGAPAPRERPAAVWTGTEMLVVGGGVPEGGRYDPAEDLWASISRVGMPPGALDCTAVWTGTQMIVWGGSDGRDDVSTGGKYVPVGDHWIPTSTAGAAAPRRGHTAVWTGLEMIVWGGIGAGGSVDTGGRYCPGCDDGNPCTADTYDPSVGCVHTPTPGTPCDDGRACTILDVCNDAGACVGQPLPPGSSCDDGNSCTTGDDCDSSGVCVGGAPPDCNDNNPCTDDSCVPAAGCAHALKSCDDGNSCTTDSCDSSTGSCLHAQLPAGTACGDGNACTANDRCDGAGSCVGQPVACQNTNPCLVASCDPARGCVYALRNCDDHDPCTDDGCSGGCVHQPRYCDDHIACTLDSCSSATGNCFHMPQDSHCDDQNAGTMDSCDPAAGGCQHIPCDSLCNDNNTCTNDLCAPATGCYHTPKAGPCDDGNACTTNDACSGYTCVGGSPLNCDDGNPCSVDSCDPVTGCVNMTIDPSCKEPKSVSFYRRVCRGEHTGEVMTEANVDCVNDSLTFAPVDMIDAMCERLDPDPGGDKCEKAEAEFMATLLNRCKGRISDDEPIDSRCSDHTVVGQSIEESDVLLSNPSRTADECMLADCESTEINSGKAIGPVLTLTMQPDGGVRLDWTALPASDSSLAPTNFSVWRGPLRGPFTKVAVVTALSYVDPPSEPGVNRHYEVTAE